MKTLNTLLAVAVVAATVGTAVTVKADYSLTFDTPDSIIAGGFNFSPPPVGVYGASGYSSGTPITTEFVAYSSTENATSGNPTSGSVQLSWDFDAADGGATAAFVIELSASGNYTFSSLSFDLMVDPGSTPDSYGGYGYFQVSTYSVSSGLNDTGFAEELANPGFGTPASPGAGVWQHITIALNGADSAVNDIALLDYADGRGTGRAITGPETLYVDNIYLTSPVPEPAGLALLGLGMTSLLWFRTSRKA